MSEIYFCDSPIPQNYNGYVDADTAIKLGVKSPKSDCNRVAGFHLATNKWVIDYSRFPIRKRRYSSREELEKALITALQKKLNDKLPL